jgi:predicted nuclease with TOPRIM domain
LKKQFKIQTIMSNEQLTLNQIKERKSKLAQEKEKLDAINKEQQELDYQEFKLQMKEVDDIRAKAKALEDGMGKPQADLVLIAYVGSQTTRLDLKNDTVRGINGLSDKRRVLVANMVTYLRDLASGQYALITNGKQHLLARYNDEQRAAARQALVEK